MLFYDHFDENEIAGVFTPIHYIVLLLYFALMALALFLSRKMNERTAVRVTLGVTVAAWAMELAKIALRIAKGKGPGSWLPVYFSSLYLYAAPLSLCKNKTLRTTGVTFLAFGSTTAGLVYAFYPSSALLLYPVWHPAAIHGMLYHWLILYVGVLTLWKRFKPKAEYFWHFFVFVTAFTIPAFICNEIWGYNFMFIGEPFALAPLQFLFDISPYLYAAVVYVAQTIALYWVWYGGYKLVKRIARKRRAVKEGELSDEKPESV